MFKKIAVLLAALAVSAPALADRGHHHRHYYGHRHVVHHYHVKHRPVVHHYHHYYRPAPRPVYVVHRPDPVVPLIVGAVIGAAIVHSTTVGYSY
jgi:hypothetical protein